MRGALELDIVSNYSYIRRQEVELNELHDQKVFGIWFINIKFRSRTDIFFSS